VRLVGFIIRNLQLSVTEARLHYRPGTILSARNSAPDLTRVRKHNTNIRMYTLTHLLSRGCGEEWLPCVFCTRFNRRVNLARVFGMKCLLIYIERACGSPSPSPVTRSTTHITVTLPNGPLRRSRPIPVSTYAILPGSIPSFMSFTCFKKCRRQLIEMQFQSLLRTVRVLGP
jgi:hypothetical protein